MFVIGDLRHTRVWQEAYEEGYEAGYEEGHEEGRQLAIEEHRAWRLRLIAKLEAGQFPAAEIADFLGLDVNLVRKATVKNA